MSVALLLIVLSVLPVILLGRYIYNNDFDKEPKGLLITLFLMGVGSVIVTVILTAALDTVFPFFSLENEAKLDIFGLIPYIFIGVALIEEFSKWIFVYLFGYHNREFNHAYDAIVYCAFVSLGFACIENILYVLQSGLSTAIFRAITAVPGHACFGVWMGFYLGMAKTADKHQNQQLSTKNKVRSLLYPVAAHGLYDYLIFGSVQVSAYTLLFLIFVIYLFTETPKKVRQLARIYYNIQEPGQMAASSVMMTSSPVMMPPTAPSSSTMMPPTAPSSSTMMPPAMPSSTEYSYQFCPICGEKVVGPFCPVCGHNHAEK